MIGRQGSRRRGGELLEIPRWSGKKPSEKETSETLVIVMRKPAATGRARNRENSSVEAQRQE